MADGKKSFIAYADWYETFKVLPDDKAGLLIKHIFAYVNDENPSTDDILINAVFANIKQQLKRDLKKWESTSLQRAEIGRLGGIKSGEARRKQAEANEAIALKSKQNEHDNVNDNVNDNDNVKKKKKKKYAEFVSMTEEEHEKLVAKHGIKNTEILIEILDNYKGSNGKKYNSDYRTILSWVIDKAKKEGKYEIRMLA